MRSIRRTLVLSFVALMALALGAVGLIIDRMAEQALAEREASSHRFIDQHASELIRQEKEKFDAELTSQATRVANDVQTKYYAQNQKDYERFINVMRLTPLGGLGAGLSPWPLGVPVWYYMPFNRQANETVARKFLSHLDLDEKPTVEDDALLILVTVQATPDRVYRSKSMEAEKWQIPHFDPGKLIDEKCDTQVLHDGTAVRVATLKSPINLALRYPRGRSPFPGSRPGPPRPEPPRTEAPQPPPPESQQVPYRTAFIQCGRPLVELDAKIAAHEQVRDDEMADEVRRTERDRRGLRTWLGVIGAVTFAVLIFGGLLLVRRGLKPLNTLTEAVGNVSEKDFLLPVEPGELSEELLPIHYRLTETLALLRRAFEHDKQAVADISHELRTPVAALLATLDVSLRKPRDSEAYKQTIVECRAITKQLQGLVERVMTLASLDATPAATVKSEVDAVELAEGCASVIRPLAESHGLTVSVNAPSPVSVNTDAEKLREVILNLLHNAIEYNRPGGRVEIAVSNGGPRAQFAVTDTGIGMTDDVKHRIFERFYRADPSRTATGIHAGLGLAIVKECVDRLGGTISVESQPGQGSQFTVELPA